MSIALIIVSFIFVLFVLVTTHEMGHFMVAKRIGVAVEEFGVGFPPRLLAIKRGETTYSLNLIPLGAFVKTAGESDPTVPNSLASKGPWARMGVYAAGPVMNIVLAFLILSLFFMLPKNVIKGDGAMVHSVEPNKPADQAHMESGDIILSIDGLDIHEWQDVQNGINSDGGTAKTLLLQRGNETFNVVVTPTFNHDYGRYTIGILLCWGIVTQVESGSLADQAGISPGDTIMEINGKVVYSLDSMNEALSSAKPGKEITFTLLQAGSSGDVVTKSLKLGPNDSPDEILNYSNTQWVDSYRQRERTPFWQSLYQGGDYLVHIPSLIKQSIPIIRENPSELAVGVVGAGQLTVEAVKSSGFTNLLLLGGLISVGLALFNFIPIPPLDGGGMLIALIEGIRKGKRLSARTVRLAYVVGTALMITAFVAIMYNDIARVVRTIVTGQSGFGL
jgi:regulator of sigma E protease